MTSQAYLNKPDDLMKLPPAPSKFGSVELQAMILDNLVGKCATCNDNGLVGGPSYSDPSEGGIPCPDCQDANGEITLEMFIAITAKDLMVFRDTWLKNNGQHPDTWPLRMKEGDWFDQYLCHAAGAGAS